MKSFNNIEKIQSDFYKLQDDKHKLFLQKLIPNKNKILGIKNKQILNFINKLTEDDICLYLEKANYEFLEEVVMYAMILSRKENNLNFVLKYIESFRLMIDNWCSCDSFIYKLKNENEKSIMWNYIEKKYFNSNDLYALRLSIVIILKNFLDKKYLIKIFNFIKSINNNEYYCEMAVSWLLSQLYFIDKINTLNFIKKNTNKFVFKKTIQKICESKKVSNNDKKNLKLLIK